MGTYQKKILFIVSHFYPNGSIVESKNNYLSVLELERYGFEVDVAAPPADTDKYPSNVRYLLNISSRTSTKSRVMRLARKLLKIPVMLIRFDDVSSIISGLKYVDLKKYDYIYTVFGNGSEHIAGMKLKNKFPHLKWIAEFRDPWVHNEISKKYLFDNGFSWYAKYQWNKLNRAQAKVLKAVDLLLVESSYHASLIKADFGYSKNIYVCNGYSDRLVPEIPELDIDFLSKPVIGFIGSTYYGYNDVAETFIRVLEEIESEGLDFTFVSIGNNYFSKLAATSQLKNYYAMHKITYPKAQGFIKKLTFGLAITMENYPSHVNSKIFEYMQYGKPTLAIAPKGGAMDTLLNTADAGVILSYRKDHMKKQLRNIFEQSYHADPQLNLAQVKAFDRKEVFSDIVSAIHKL